MNISHPFVLVDEVKNLLKIVNMLYARIQQLEERVRKLENTK